MQKYLSHSTPPEVVSVCDGFELLPVLSPSVVRKEPDKASMNSLQLFREISNVLSHNLVFWSFDAQDGLDPDALELEIRHDPAYVYFRRKAPLP